MLLAQIDLDNKYFMKSSLPEGLSWTFSVQIDFGQKDFEKRSLSKSISILRPKLRSNPKLFFCSRITNPNWIHHLGWTCGWTVNLSLDSDTISILEFTMDWNFDLGSDSILNLTLHSNLEVDLDRKLFLKALWPTSTWQKTLLWNLCGHKGFHESFFHIGFGQKGFHVSYVQVDSKNIHTDTHGQRYTRIHTANDTHGYTRRSGK